MGGCLVTPDRSRTTLSTLIRRKEALRPLHSPSLHRRWPRPLLRGCRRPSKPRVVPLRSTLFYPKRSACAGTSRRRTRCSSSNHRRRLPSNNIGRPLPKTHTRALQPLPKYTHIHLLWRRCRPMLPRVSLRTVPLPQTVHRHSLPPVPRNHCRLMKRRRCFAVDLRRRTVVRP